MRIWFKFPSLCCLNININIYLNYLPKSQSKLNILLKQTILWGGSLDKKTFSYLTILNTLLILLIFAFAVIVFVSSTSTVDARFNRLYAFLNTSFSAFETKNTTSSLTQNISKLQQRLTTDEADILALKNRPIPADRSADINALQSKVVQLQAQYDTCSASIANLSTYVKNLNYTNTTVYYIVYLNSSKSANATPYLCDVSGVPSDLLFQYMFSCTCDLRKTYGPYLNVGSACHVNNDWNACACYETICNAIPAKC